MNTKLFTLITSLVSLLWDAFQMVRNYHADAVQTALYATPPSRGSRMSPPEKADTTGGSPSGKG